MEPTWTYYCEGHPDGSVSLFRAALLRQDQVYRRLSGWHDSPALRDLVHQGWISSSDIIDEAEALALARQLDSTAAGQPSAGGTMAGAGAAPSWDARTGHANDNRPT